MDWQQRIQDVQRHLQSMKIDGWLLFDFQNQNPLAREFLKLPLEMMVTRRYLYWIPAHGEPTKIQHVIEPASLSHLPGKKLSYLTWQELESTIAKVVKGSKTVAMEYSSRNANPYISKVDGGMLDLVRSCGVEIVSSGDFLQYYTCELSEEQLASHVEAGAFLDQTVHKAWEMISECLKTNQRIDEYGIQQFICQEFERNGFLSEGNPICGVNAHSADPHYEPGPKGSAPVQKGDFVLIDLWCKKKKPQAIYGDICRVGVADSHPTPRQQEIFSIVRKAQKLATDFVAKKWAAGELIKGCDVDRISRQVIVDAGYGQYFTHRTGHNIYTKDHGPGAHIDSLETLDERLLIPKTCFSIEPGIYIPDEFGVRLEYDVYLNVDRTIQISGGIQEEIVTLL